MRRKSGVKMFEMYIDYKKDNNKTFVKNFMKLIRKLTESC